MNANGHVIPNTPIVVDFWDVNRVPKSCIFFLTHMHADHIKGLNNKWKFPIYTSPLNVKFLKNKFKFPDTILCPLEIDVSHLISLDLNGNVMMSVTPFNACHIPGAVMFLFQGYFGNILYCGDMRWQTSMINYPLLFELAVNRDLDVLYLDNTFCADYCIFPSRQIVTNDIFNIIRSHPDHTIKLAIRLHGREELLVSIAKEFKTKIVVSHEKLKIIELSGICSHIFTVNENESRIHTFFMNQMSIKRHKFWNRSKPTITIFPTALFVGWNFSPYSQQQKNGIYVVPYSDHSSYDELIDMVSTLSPRLVIPIVTQFPQSGFFNGPSAPDCSVKAKMDMFALMLNPTPLASFNIPDEVQQSMIQEAVRDVQSLATQSKRRKILRSPSRVVKRARHISFSSLENENLPNEINVLNSEKKNSALIKLPSNVYNDGVTIENNPILKIISVSNMTEPTSSANNDFVQQNIVKFGFHQQNLQEEEMADISNVTVTHSIDLLRKIREVSQEEKNGSCPSIELLTSILNALQASLTSKKLLEMQIIFQNQ